MASCNLAKVGDYHLIYTDSRGFAWVERPLEGSDIIEPVIMENFGDEHGNYAMGHGGLPKHPVVPGAPSFIGSVATGSPVNSYGVAFYDSDEKLIAWFRPDGTKMTGPLSNTRQRPAPRLVWFVTVGNLPWDKIESFINDVRRKIKESLDKGEDFFFPVRKQDDIVVKDLNDLSGGHHGIITVCGATSDVEKGRIEEFTEEFKAKLKDGSYDLNVGDDKMIVVPVPPDIIIDLV